MSSRPTDPDDDIARLLDDGYDLTLRNGHLLIRQVPYLGPDGFHDNGLLVLPINDSDDRVTDAVGDHTIWFSGAEPRDERDRPLGSPQPRDLGDGLTTSFMLSFKPASGSYPTLYDKVQHYARVLRDAARRVDAAATATPGADFQVVEDGLPLVYRDTNTTRAGLTALNNLFRGHVVAIVGLGGTGSYILDQVAKTWTDRIILIDGDEFENHNAFRAPGAAAHEALKAGQYKADYFAEQYSRMHTGIEAHVAYLTAENLDLLTDATFVFVAAADADERPTIMAWLRQRGTPFIDVGMGISEGDAGLTGLLKVTTYLPDGEVALPTVPAVPPGQDDYSSNIQVADLNALNALLAVIQWKRWLGFYATHIAITETVYKLYLNELRNGDAA